MLPGRDAERLSADRRGALAEAPEGFLSLRVEGADYGPVTVQRAALMPRAGRKSDVTVPRKAELQIGAKTEQRITASVYAQDDASFRNPLFRGEVEGGGGGSLKFRRATGSSP